MIKIICSIPSETDEKDAGGLWDFAGELAETAGLERGLETPVYAEEYGQEAIYNRLRELVVESENTPSVNDFEVAVEERDKDAPYRDYISDLQKEIDELHEQIEELLEEIDDKDCKEYEYKYRTDEETIRLSVKNAVEEFAEAVKQALRDKVVNEFGDMASDIKYITLDIEEAEDKIDELLKEYNYD